MVDQFTSLKVQNEKSFDEKQQMRFLMANAAHDLKTPLASFTMGMDVIRQTVVDMETKISQLRVPNPRLQEMLVMLKSQLAAMEAQSQFMTMSINRCMDYTKITNGSELTCQPETIDLLESLQRALLFIPLILGDELSHISVSLDPLPASICTYIITDARWLQENLLCLVEQSKPHLLRILRTSPSSELSLTIRLSLEIENSPPMQSPSPSLSYRMSSIISANNSPSPSMHNHPSNHLHTSTSINHHHNNSNRSSPQQTQSLIPHRPAGASPGIQTSRAARSKLAQSLRYLSANDDPSAQASTINFIQEDSSLRAAPEKSNEKSMLFDTVSHTPATATSSPSSFQAFSSPAPSHRLRMELIWPIYIPEMSIDVQISTLPSDNATVTLNMCNTNTNDRLFQHGKSHAEMNLVNYEARLRSLKGHGGRSTSVEHNITTWYFTIPYRPDVARQQVRASFLRGNSWHDGANQDNTGKSAATSATASAMTAATNMRTPITYYQQPFTASSTSTSCYFPEIRNQMVSDSLDTSLSIPQIGLTLSSKIDRGDFIPSNIPSLQPSPYTSYYQPHVNNSTSALTSTHNSIKYPFFRKESSTAHSNASSFYDMKNETYEESDVPVSPRLIDVCYNPTNAEDTTNASETSGNNSGTANIVGVTTLSSAPTCVDISESDAAMLSPLASVINTQKHFPDVPQTTKPPIYLVDDSTFVLKITRTVLERSGYTVQVARNGLEAVQTICDWIDGHSAFLRKNEEIEIEATVTNPASSASKHNHDPTPDHSNHNIDNMDNDDMIGSPAPSSSNSHDKKRTQKSSNYTSPSNNNNNNNIWQDVSLLPVVLMDLQMPVLDGIEAVRRIRSSEEAKLQQQKLYKDNQSKLVIIALSANNYDEIVQEALAAGCDAFIQKPFNLEEFQQVMQHIEIYRTQEVFAQHQSIE